MKKIKEIDIEIYNQHEHIYSTIPEFLRLEDFKQKVKYIKIQEIKKWFQEHKGKQNAIPLNKIAKELGFSNNGNSLEFRYLVTEILENHTFPIASCSRGYFYPITKDEVDDNIETELKRIQGVRRRIRALTRVSQRINRISPKRMVAGKSTLEYYIGNN